ncbi:MAG: DUF4249 domain-containing protein [Mariniphaga sp.]
MKQFRTQYNHYKSPLNHHKSPPNHHQSHFYFSLLLLFIFIGCERVIDVDLNESNPQIVIEGNLSYNDAELEVRISKTGSYFSTTQIEKVNDAEVYLVNSEGTRVEAEAFGNGIYKIENYPLEQKKEYHLFIESEGQKYDAKSTLHPPVKIDSLGFEYQKDVRFFEGGYRLLLYFSDPPDEENFYRIKVFKNEELFNSVDDLIVFDDSGLNGKGIQVTLRRQLFDVGDTAYVQFLTIDEKSFLYFSTFREMANTNPGSPAPANPISNFSNGALGYFSAWSFEEKEIIIE